MRLTLLLTLSLFQTANHDLQVEYEHTILTLAYKNLLFGPSTQNLHPPHVYVEAPSSCEFENFI